MKTSIIKLSWHLQESDESLGNYSDCFDKLHYLKMWLEMSSWQEKLGKPSQGHILSSITTDIFIFTTRRKNNKVQELLFLFHSTYK